MSLNPSSNRFHTSHKYLAQNPPINEFSPASVDRIVTKILQTTEPDAVAPPTVAVIVAKSEPYIWAPWTDLTRTRIAYGRLCLPKLKKDLGANHTLIICQALCTLSDMLHDPEVAWEVFSLNLQARFVKLLLNENPFVRQRTLMCIRTLAQQPFGQIKLSKNVYLLRNIKTCLQDDSYLIKNQAIMAIHTLLSNSFVTKILIEEDHIKMIIKCLIQYSAEETQEFYDENCMVLLLECLTQLIQDSDAAKVQAMAYDIFLLFDLLSSKNHKIRNAIAIVYAELFKHEIGKLASFHWPFLQHLTAALDIMKPWHNLGILNSLRFATISTESKKQIDVHDLIDNLTNVVSKTDDPEILVNITQILINLAESPEGRKQLRDLGTSLMYSFDSSKENVKRNVIRLFDIINKPL